MSDFETRVQPVVEKVARRFFKDEQLIQDAVGHCWYLYDQSPRRLEVTATAFAYAAVKQIRAGRNVPMGQRKRKDIMNRRAWQAAAMNGLADRRPGPEQIAEWKETVKAILEKAKGKPKLKQFLELAMAGENRTGKLAELLGVTAARVSQYRSEAAALV